jgi:hypothetical protein
MNNQWNNWNVGTGAIQAGSGGAVSGLFKYGDGSPSSVYAVLDIQGGLSDNGAAYAQNATMCPDTALRFTSYITSKRYLTIQGLDNASKYNVELYSSRSGTGGQITKFTIGLQSIDVSTDNNTSSAAAFSSISPSSGNIVVTITRVVTHNFLNGFKITKISGGGGNMLAAESEVAENNASGILSFPNPVSDNLTIINKKNNPLSVEIFDLAGRKLLQSQQNAYNSQVNMNRFKAGSYVLVVTDERTRQVTRKIIVKLQK